MAARPHRLGADGSLTDEAFDQIGRPAPFAPLMTDVAVSRYAVYVGRFRVQARLVALALLTVLIVTQHPGPSGHGRGLVILVSLVVTVALAAAAVLVPQRHPTTRVALEALACGILVGYDPGTSAVLLFFVGLDAAESLPFTLAAYFTALAVIVAALATVVAGTAAANATYGLVAVGGFLLGTTIRQFALRAEQAELRMADMERVEIERSRAAHLAERANAAREIHDILAHNLGALIVQLDAVNAVMESDHPNLDAIRPVLRDAHQHAVDGLAEARHAVSSLREDGQPLEVSIRQLSDTNPHTSFELCGQPRPVPADVEFTVRRIVQEAMTNAAKHAPGSQVSVQVSFQPSALDVTVTDDGPPVGTSPSVLAGTGGGFGLEGMRERAELIGARLRAGPRAGGWQVRLTVPDRATPR